MKIIKIKFNGGRRYSLSADIVAFNRTRCYAEKDNYERDSIEWEREYRYCIEEDSELEDWLFNNMSWSDIEHHVTELPRDEEELELDHMFNFGLFDFEITNQPLSTLK